MNEHNFIYTTVNLYQECSTHAHLQEAIPEVRGHEGRRIDLFIHYTTVNLHQACSMHAHLQEAIFEVRGHQGRRTDKELRCL